jgi:large subunit ribosomal protein L1
VGKISFSLDALVENTRSLVDAIQKAKPATAKGKYVHTIFLCSTMGPGVQVDPVSLDVK